MKKLANRHPRTDWTADGTELHLVRPLVRTKNRPVYTSKEGVPYLRELRKDKCTGKYVWQYRRLTAGLDTTVNSKFNSGRKQRYLKLSDSYGNILVSHTVCLAWNGPRPEGYECDHINGVTMDNRASNLQWVMPEENRRRARYLRALRKLMPNHARIFYRADYLRWFSMPLEDFTAMLSRFTRVDPSKVLMERNSGGDAYEGE